MSPRCHQREVTPPPPRHWRRERRLARLAEASKVAKATIANFEASKRQPYARTLDDLRAALESAGVIFVDENGEGPGVRLRKKLRLHNITGGVAP